MAAHPSIDPTDFLHEHLAQASPDLLRSLLTSMIDTLMSAEADAVCGAVHGERSAERVNQRNGYRHRDFDTRAGTLDVAIPKLRSGSYFPDWLLERRRRAEAALTSVVATCYLLGVSTRRMEKPLDSLGITRLSKSQVSVMARDLDEQVAAFRTRPLDGGPYTFVAADALVLKVREGGRVVGVHAMIATGVNADGHRELLGLHVSSAEDGAGWLANFGDLTARGLSGVALVTSDAHAGLVEAVGACLPGAAWQRCRTHWSRYESTCRRVGVRGPRLGGRGEELGGGAVAGRGWRQEMTVVFEQGTGFADDGADRGAADVAEGFGQRVEGAPFSQVEDGEQDPFAVADLLGKHAATGARLARAAASLVGEPFGVGGLAGREALDEVAQLVAAHPGQGRIGERFDDPGSGRVGVVVEEGEQVGGGGEPYRGESGVLAVVFEDFAGVVDEVGDAGGRDFEQLAQHIHRAHLPLVEQREQQPGGIVEQRCAAQVPRGSSGAAAALLGVALLGASGLRRG